MSSDVYTKLLASPVADNGTIVFSYAAGKEAADYSDVGHSLYASGLQADFPIASDGIGVVFGVSDITVTYKGATTIPATTKVSLDAVLKAFEPVEGDLEITNLLVAETLEVVGDSQFDYVNAGDMDVGVFSATSVLTPLVKTETNVGTVSGNCVAEEHGDGVNHFTKLTLTAFAVGTGDDALDKAIGAKCYTFPAGTILVGLASIKGIFDQASHGTITDGECGLGTVVGSTAVDTLGEVGATSENIIQGDAGVLSTYVLGTTVVEAADFGGVSGGPFVILSAGVHDVFLNLAATWPNIAAPEAVTFTGVITIEWKKIS